MDGKTPAQTLRSGDILSFLDSLNPDERTTFPEVPGVSRPMILVRIGATVMANIDMTVAPEKGTTETASVMACAHATVEDARDCYRHRVEVTSSELEKARRAASQLANVPPEVLAYLERVTGEKITPANFGGVRTVTVDARGQVVDGSGDRLDTRDASAVAGTEDGYRPGMYL